MSNEKSRIVVRGPNILRPPLLDTTGATLIEFYGPDDKLMALVVNVLSPFAWCLVTKDDPDWGTTLLRYGYLNIDRPIQDILRTGI
jgi:hypothetical protein